MGMNPGAGRQETVAFLFFSLPVTISVHISIANLMIHNVCVHMHIVVIKRVATTNLSFRQSKSCLVDIAGML